MPTIGLYPGTFDPIHDGHVAFAQEARDQFGLDAVYFLPENMPRDKQRVSNIDKRVQLISNTVSASTGLNVLKLQSERFTINGTLPEIERIFPNHEFALLMGSDVAMNLANWGSLERIFPRYLLVIGLRGNTTKQEVKEVLKAVEAVIQKHLTVSFIKTPYAYISSSAVNSKEDLA